MEKVLDFLNTNKPRGFKPRPYYSAEGDSLTFFFEDRPYYGERIDDFLTVYKALEGGDLVGCQIKGLPKALKLLGDFGLMITDGKVLLTMIFMAFMAQSPEPQTKERYRELGKLAAGRNVSIPAKELAPFVEA